VQSEKPTESLHFPRIKIVALEEQIADLTNALGAVREDLKAAKLNGRGRWEPFWRVLGIVVMPVIIIVAAWMLSLNTRVVRVEEALSSPHIIELLGDHETRIRALERSR